MVPCSWFSDAAERARANPELDLGVHLVLNCEYARYRWGPVAGRRAVPSLLDDQGYLPRTVPEVLARAKPEEVEIELRSQIEHALAAGVDVTHLDSHMGAVFAPNLVEIYAKLGAEFRLPVFAVRPDRPALEKRGLAGLLGVLERVVASIEACGLPVFDAFDADSLDFEPGTGAEHNRGRIARLGQGVTYLICHPAVESDELRAMAEGSAHHRAFEHRFYGSDEGVKVLEEHGVKTVGMRALRDLVRAA
jgi:predicted glycoside hydrolase/deacetylase ChbG (UPF0249 family)